MTRRKPTRRKSSGSQVDYVAQCIEKLDAGISDLGESEGWKTWLGQQARFHTYSFRNCLLITLQCPGATQVASYKRWQELGRQVREKERSIKILAPMPRTVKEVDKKGEEQERSYIAYRAVSVFDVSQTDGEPLVEHPCVTLTGGDEGALDALIPIAATLGYRLEFKDTAPANGYTMPDKKLIAIASDNEPRMQAKTLAHELGHAIMHPKGYACTPRSLAELEAESVAYVVSEFLGLDTSGYSFGYVAHWSGGTGEASKALRSSAQTIAAAAKQIITALEPEASLVAAEAA